jgi:SET domain-containing protein
MSQNLSATQALLTELRDDTWVMLRPSPVEGVGVFAVRDIPRGCRRMFGQPDAPEHWVPIARADIDTLPPHARFLVENYCLYDETHYFVPASGFKKMDLVCYLNHSDAPNVASINDGDYFEALRDIAAGEELFIDYGKIVDEQVVSGD